MKRSLLVPIVYLALGACSSEVEVDGALGSHSQALVQHRAAPVGLSLRFDGGAASPLTLVEGAARFVQELDLTESVASIEDEGIQPLIESSAWAALDWSGVRQVEEIWVPSLDGTFTRERYFRDAGWMEQSSVFQLQALDASGGPAGASWVVAAGRDDGSAPPSDVFIRRFNARQLAVGCPGIGDCAGASFVAEGLVQLRAALDAPRQSRVVPACAASLRLSWNRLPSAPFEVAVSTVEEPALQPGFEVELEPEAPPNGGSHYEPGESVSFRVTFRDGQGNRLHPPGQLPTYADFLAGVGTGGLRYLDLSVSTRLYYALKHRESTLLATLSGPTDELATPQTVVDPLLFFGPQVPFATTAVDGFTSVAQTVPPSAIVFGGLGDPSLWALPVSDVLTFTIPLDAQPGTYVLAVKARRDFQGEALNRGATVEIAVGESAPTTFTPDTVCVDCHGEPETSFASLLHGVEDRRACFGCHASLGIELDNALDIRVHTIHDRSDRFDADIRDCGLCHLSPPTGPARGLLE